MASYGAGACRQKAHFREGVAELGGTRLPLPEKRYQLASVIAGGPAPLIATALLAATGSGYVIAVYILFCAVVSIVASLMMTDYTNRDISREHA